MDREGDDVIDHTLNLFLKERAIRRAELEAAQREHRLDEITGAAANLRNVQDRITERLRQAGKT